MNPSRNISLAAYFNEAEAQRVTKQAEHEGLTISAFLRTRALK